MGEILNLISGGKSTKETALKLLRDFIEHLESKKGDVHSNEVMSLVRMLRSFLFKKIFPDIKKTV